MGNTLAAEGTVRLADALMSRNIDGRPGTRAFHIPDAESLYFFTDLYAAHALDTFGGIPDQGKLLIPCLFPDFHFKRNIDNVQIIRYGLKTAVTAPFAAHAVGIML